MINPVTVAIVFFFTWWLVLLLSLPFGITPADEPEKGHSTGAPRQAHLKKKLLITTLLSIVITFLFFWLTGGVIVSPDMET